MIDITNGNNYRNNSTGVDANGLQQGLQQKDSAVNQFEERMLRLQKAVNVESDSGLARALGISHQSVASARKRKQLPYAWIAEISERYGISADWLLFGEGPMKRGEAQPIYIKEEGEPGEELRVMIPQWENPDLDYYDFVPMAEAHLSAGGGAFVLSESIKNYFAFRKDWLRKVATSVRNLVLMNVRGHSMEPTIMEGDTVLIDTGRTRIYDGCIYALRQGDIVAVKRLERLAGGRIRIISDNRNEYPPYEAHIRDLHILGQIIWYARELIKKD